MRDIVSDLRSALYGRIGVMAADLLFANAADEIVQLRAALTTSRADAMEECAKLVEAEPVLPGPLPESLQSVSPECMARMAVRLTNRQLATEIRQLKDKADE